MKGKTEELWMLETQPGDRQFDGDGLQWKHTFLVFVDSLMVCYCDIYHITPVEMSVNGNEDTWIMAKMSTRVFR